jgi:putative endonuclease
MWYVYILKSKTKPFIYTGYTKNIKRRIGEHNAGLCLSTRPYKPFSLEVFVAVKTKKKAIQLEKYFKTGSGIAILKKRILADKS